MPPARMSTTKATRMTIGSMAKCRPQPAAQAGDDLVLGRAGEAGEGRGARRRPGRGRHGQKEARHGPGLFAWDHNAPPGTARQSGTSLTRPALVRSPGPVAIPVAGSHRLMGSSTRQ